MLSGHDGFAEPILRLTTAQLHQILGHCYDGLPEESCGLIGGPLRSDGIPVGEVWRVYPCRNSDASARTYTVESQDHIRALRDAEGMGGDLIGVFHSHTHTDAYPSETDVRQAVEPGWVYMLVSLRHEAPVVRAFRICDGTVREVAIDVMR